jgi:hypothetical protein
MLLTPLARPRMYRRPEGGRSVVSRRARTAATQMLLSTERRETNGKKSKTRKPRGEKAEESDISQRLATVAGFAVVSG